MITLPLLSPAQRTLTQKTLAKRTMYPVTFRINALASSAKFTLPQNSDEFGIRYVQFAYTPPFTAGISGIHFSATVSDGTLPNTQLMCGAQVSYNATTPAIFGAGTTLLEDDGNVIFRATGGLLPASGASSNIRTLSFFRKFRPFNYYLGRGAPVYIYFLSDIFSVNIPTVVMTLTLHLMTTNQLI